jgi:hypothetical protein
VVTQTQVIKGTPDRSMFLNERQNLTMRMSMRRFTRLRNAFSKTFENHWHALALISFFYNFWRVNKTLGVSPAMASGRGPTKKKDAEIFKVRHYQGTWAIL